MKKRVLVMVSTLMLVTSCAYTTKAGVIFDDTVPLEQTAWIAVSVGAIVGYNGIEVNWKTAGVYTSNMIQVPAGETQLEWDIKTVDIDTIYTGKGLLMSYHFKPQKQYFFTMAREEGEPGLIVYEYDFGEKWVGSGEDMDAHRVGFSPFLNIAKTILK